MITKRLKARPFRTCWVCALANESMHAAWYLFEYIRVNIYILCIYLYIDNINTFNTLTLHWQKRQKLVLYQAVLSRSKNFKSYPAAMPRKFLGNDLLGILRGECHRDLRRSSPMAAKEINVSDENRDNETKNNQKPSEFFAEKIAHHHRQISDHLILKLAAPF